VGGGGVGAAKRNGGAAQGSVWWRSGATASTGLQSIGRVPVVLLRRLDVLAPVEVQAFRGAGGLEMRPRSPRAGYVFASLLVAAVAASCGSQPPVAVTFDTLRQYPDGTTVIIEGDLGLCSRFEKSDDFSCLELFDRDSQQYQIRMWIRDRDYGTDSQPNRMRPLPSMYESEDLLVWLDDGTEARAGDRVRVTGRLRYYDNGVPSIYPVTKVEQSTTMAAASTTTTTSSTVAPAPAEMSDLMAACRGEGVLGVAEYDGARDRIHPVAVFLMDGGGVEYDLWLPSEWHDRSSYADPTVVELVVCVEVAASTVSRECSEEAAGYTPVDEEYTIRLVEAASGAEVARTTFTVIDELCRIADTAALSGEWISSSAVEEMAEEFLVRYVAPEIGNPAPAESIFASTFQSVCRGVPIPAAAVYAPNAAGPHPVLLFSGVHPEYNEETPDLPDGWGPGAEATRTQLVACVDRVSEEPATTCHYQDASGHTAAWQLIDAVYEVTLRRATDAGIVDSTTINARSGDCPLIVFLGQTSQYPSIDEAIHVFLQPYVE
jgi:hypothetical protein